MNDQIHLEGNAVVKNWLAVFTLMFVSEVALADVFKCDHGLLTRVKTEGSSVKQLGPIPNSGQYELEISNWKKNSIGVTEILKGKRFKESIPAEVSEGIYRTDHTMKKGNTISTTNIEFNVHSKKALIVYTLTKGNISIRSTFDGYCE